MSLCGCKVLKLYQTVEELVPDCEWDTCWSGGINVATINLQNLPRLKLNTTHLIFKQQIGAALPSLFLKLAENLLNPPCFVVLLLKPQPSHSI